MGLMCQRGSYKVYGKRVEFRIINGLIYHYHAHIPRSRSTWLLGNVPGLI